MGFLKLLRTEKPPSAVGSLSDHVRKRCLKNTAENRFGTFSVRKSFFLPFVFDFADQTSGPLIIGGIHFRAQLLQIQRQIDGIGKYTAFEIIKKNRNRIFEFHISNRRVFGSVQIFGNRQCVIEIFVLAFHCNDADHLAAAVNQRTAAVSGTGRCRKTKPVPFPLFHFGCIAG